MRAVVAVGLGIALVPRLALTNLRSDVRIVPVQQAVSRRILLAQLAERRPTPAEDEIVTVFRAVSASMAHYRP